MPVLFLTEIKKPRTGIHGLVINQFLG